MITVFGVTLYDEWQQARLSTVDFRHSGRVALPPSKPGSGSSEQTVSGDEHKYSHCMALKWTIHNQSATKVDDG